MDNNIKYFFSYSRKDSEFVLRLASDLRNAGANLWLDQLDIEGGERWDDAIQKALVSCEGMLAVLSPDAVISNNAKDEISYALEEGKRIIPVLHRECAIPFRLRRLQHIDFSADYEKGLAQLLKALKLVSPAGAAQLKQEESSEVLLLETVEKRQPEEKKTAAEGQRNPERPPTGVAKAVPILPIIAPAPKSPNLYPVEISGIWRKVFERLLTMLGNRGTATLIGFVALTFLNILTETIAWGIIAVSLSKVLVFGVFGAIAGAITGTNRKVVLVAVAGYVLGTVVFSFVTEWTTSDYNPAPMEFGGSLGVVIGAVVGIIVKKIKRLE